MKARFIGSTMVAGVRKYRWECSICGRRFNLVPKREKHICKYCKTELSLIQEVK